MGTVVLGIVKIIWTKKLLQSFLVLPNKPLIPKPFQIRNLPKNDPPIPATTSIFAAFTSLNQQLYWELWVCMREVTT